MPCRGPGTGACRAADRAPRPRGRTVDAVRADAGGGGLGPAHRLVHVRRGHGDLDNVLRLGEALCGNVPVRGPNRRATDGLVIVDLGARQRGLRLVGDVLGVVAAGAAEADQRLASRAGKDGVDEVLREDVGAAVAVDGIVDKGGLLKGQAGKVGVDEPRRVDGDLGNVQRRGVIARSNGGGLHEAGD
ncbi:hypothetical protein NLG97_g8170 [Lecanicillium saksenae]|uniref:Uncharacterized protein n=1 Tax=Lecanicillium saksenae TaxID=468837 RepID=A0ACC1QMZ7_9HYPO|nr:hypothetical protein NLG97_g8170 [Lecanicillium saksenae]